MTLPTTRRWRMFLSRAPVVLEAHRPLSSNPVCRLLQVHKKPRCPVKGCKEKLTTVNVYKCKACLSEVCLKHRFPSDHGCEERKAARSSSRSGWYGLNRLAAGTQAQPPARPARANPSPRPSAAARPAAAPRPEPQGNTVRVRFFARLMLCRILLCTALLLLGSRHGA